MLSRAAPRTSVIDNLAHLTVAADLWLFRLLDVITHRRNIFQIHLEQAHDMWGQSSAIKLQFGFCWGVALRVVPAQAEINNNETTAKRHRCAFA